MAQGVKWLLLFILLVGIVSATSTSLGIFEQGKDITLFQSCDLSSYSNISRVTFPNSTIALFGDVAMVPGPGNTYTYVFSNTDTIGQYLVYGHCDENSVDTVWVYDLQITYTGSKVSLSNAIVVIAFLFVAGIFLVLGFSFNQDHWILKTFFNFSAVAMGILAINSAKIVASESMALGKMGNVGLTIGIAIFGIFFLYMFVYYFIEAIKTFKQKRGVRWEY
jgi:hypothetical protein